ncbi:MAG: DNA polymerase III subunit beta [Gammaproteobacteria bacterium]|nr:MAG: DNA polymerase III subunit beta [Gammaproteobacteria bacterium]
MKFQISRDVILKALQQLSGVVERRQTLPVLGNILVKADENSLTLAATDLEVELIINISCNVDQSGDITIPARKWLDICRNLSEDSEISVSLKNDRVSIQSGKSRFALSSLPATEFPLVEDVSEHISFNVSRSVFRNILEATHFSMAQQDVRYYLNGLMFEMDQSHLRCVATDGHRLALKNTQLQLQVNEDKRQVIVPRKAIQELMRLLGDGEEEITVLISNSYIRIIDGELVFTSKLIDGRFPDYERVLPQGGNNIVISDKETLKQTLIRVAILSNEKYRGIRINLSTNNMHLMAHNPEQEEAEDEFQVDYKGDDIEIGFNANYLLDAINAVRSDQVKIVLSDSSSSCIIQSPEDDQTLYVVMPMRL